MQQERIVIDHGVSRPGKRKVRPSGGQLTGRKWTGSQVKEQIYWGVKSWKVCRIRIVVSMGYWFESIKDVICPKGVGY